MEHNSENEEGTLIQGKGNHCSKLKKGKLKTKNLLKLLGILDEKDNTKYNTLNRPSSAGESFKILGKN